MFLEQKICQILLCISHDCTSTNLFSLCFMDCIQSSEITWLLLFTECWKGEKWLPHKSHIYTYQENQCMWDSMNLCTREVCLIGFIEVCNLGNCLHNNCNWQGKKVQISLSASKSTMCDLRRIVKLWKTWNESSGLLWWAMQCSLLSISLISLVEWIYPLYLKQRALGEKTIPAWDTNLIRERSNMNKAFANTAGHWQVWYLVSRNPFWAKLEKQRGLDLWTCTVFACCSETTNCRRLEMKSAALIITSHPKYYQA